jgi:hypothetical protein
MYTHIYIRPIRPSECLHTKIHVPAGQHSTSVQKSAHQPIYNQKIYIIHQCLYRTTTCSSWCLYRHHLLLPQEEVVAHHHLPQVVVDHPQDPPAPGGRASTSHRGEHNAICLSRMGAPHPLKTPVRPLRTNPAQKLKTYFYAG